MRLQVVAIGRLKSGPERDLTARYRDRAAAIGRALGFSGPDVMETPESRARRADDRRAEELVGLRGRLSGTVVVLFAEGAASMSSADFAAWLASGRDAGRAGASFTIGGPDGTHPELEAQADLAVSFGRMTLPHGLVRVLVCEQIYRALTILAGHPYHRDGDGGSTKVGSRVPGRRRAS